MSVENTHQFIMNLKEKYDKKHIIGYENSENHDSYINSMDEKVKEAMSIAVDHLGSSFHLTKSNGYLDYNKSKTNVKK